MIQQHTDIPELQYLGASLSTIQKTLKEMFFSQQTQTFLVKQIEALWVDSESTLQTVF
jgi:hypothetical protein